MPRHLLICCAVIPILKNHSFKVIIGYADRTLLVFVQILSMVALSLDIRPGNIFAEIVAGPLWLRWLRRTQSSYRIQPGCRYRVLVCSQLQSQGSTPSVVKRHVNDSTAGGFLPSLRCRAVTNTSNPHITSNLAPYAEFQRFGRHSARLFSGTQTDRAPDFAYLNSAF